jgi:hypothetical protein
MQHRTARQKTNQWMTTIIILSQCRHKTFRSTTTSHTARSRRSTINNQLTTTNSKSATLACLKQPFPRHLTSYALEKLIWLILDPNQSDGLDYRSVCGLATSEFVRCNSTVGSKGYRVFNSTLWMGRMGRSMGQNVVGGEMRDYSAVWWLILGINNGAKDRFRPSFAMMPNRNCASLVIWENIV